MSGPIVMPFMNKKIIPFLSDALFWLNGEISGNTFVDVSGNSRHFDIVNKDFSDNWGNGFPYKSASVITAPTGDATLIAADINNFLYDSGGTPNEIPVISFFQDIDYEHKLFCRHISQVVNGNSVETAEPYITDIVLYNSVLSGADLITAQSYYSVPIEDVSAFWVAADGNDTTGDGSKSLPWLTSQKAATAINDGSVAYLKTQIYDDEAGGYLYNLNNNSILAIGRALINNSNATYGIRTSDDDPDKFSRIYLKTTTPNFPMFLASPSLENEYVFIDSDTCSRLVFGQWKTFKYSIFKGQPSVRALEADPNINAVIVDTCLFKDIPATAILFDSGAYGSISILNNKVIVTADFFAIAALLTSENCTIKGNHITAYSSGIKLDGGGNISYNTILKPLLAAAQPAIELLNSDFSSVNNNNITYTGADGFGYGILGTNKPVLIEKNIITSEYEVTNFGDIRMLENLAGSISSIKVDNNKIIVPRISPYHIGVGSETTDAGENQIQELEIQKNYIKGSYALGSLIGTTHGIFVGFQIDALMNYNYEIGIRYGYVIKGSTGTVYTSNGCSYNIIQECPRGVLVKGAQAVYVTNNTIINKTLDFEWGVDLSFNIGTGTDDSDNCVVKNNIIIALGAGTNVMISLDAGASNVFDYNLYYCPNGTPTWGGVDFATWQGLGNDLNSKVLTDNEFNALFTDFDNNDFSLAVGSVAIGFGEDLGINYDDGLDASTDWGSDTEIPAVVLKTQSGSWDVGAYIS